MIKVFSFVASGAGEESRTARYSDALAAALAKKAMSAGERIDYERMTGADLRIGFCRSCNSCFTKGVCPMDQADDLPILKQKLLESDVIFFGTPVYLADISGITRCVLDRISYWSHRFELAGKLGVTFATTSNSFGQATADRLKDMLTYTGLTVVHSGYAVTTAGHPNVYVDQEIEPEMDAIADTIMAAWKDPRPFITPFQEAMLISRNRINKRARSFADLIDGQPWDETVVCEARGFATLPSFADLVMKMKDRNWDDLTRELSASTSQPDNES
ncbi:MAG: flavodoxin family protein [Lachnospiraceae bacterium]|nr:flavodoxin family protein [Lachnospiraceae bacterium]